MTYPNMIPSHRRYKMNFKQKLGYLFIGCLFTLAGYFLASLGNHTQIPNAHAQQKQDVIDEIVCKRIVIVNEAGKKVVVMGIHENDGGFISVRDKDGEARTGMATMETGGLIGLFTKGKIIPLLIGSGEAGEAFIMVRDKDGKDIDLMDRTESDVWRLIIKETKRTFRPVTTGK